MDELLRNLLDALDTVGDEHEEIYDTECRERMGDAIVYLFINPLMGYSIPEDFGLRGKRANRQVSDAISRYARDATEMARQLGLNSFHQRLEAFQNDSVESAQEGNYYDDYFGWMNPAGFDEQGNAIT